METIYRYEYAEPKKNEMTRNGKPARLLVRTIKRYKIDGKMVDGEESEEELIQIGKDAYFSKLRAQLEEAREEAGNSIKDIQNRLEEIEKDIQTRLDGEYKTDKKKTTGIEKIDAHL